MIRGAHTRFDFGTMAQEYEGWYETPRGKAHDREQQTAVRQLLPFPTYSARLLDVGCGTGHWSRFLASLGFKVTGVDPSWRMIEQARFHDGGHYSWSIADGCCLPFGDALFDVVSAMAVIEFVLNAEAIIAEMFRCVREDGAVIIGTLNRLAPLNHARVAETESPYSSARLFSPVEVQDLLAPYGTVQMQVADPSFDHDENWQNGAFIVAKVGNTCGTQEDAGV